MFISVAEYERQLEALGKTVNRRRARHVNTEDERLQVRALVTTWFETVRTTVVSAGLPEGSVHDVDNVLRECMELTLGRTERGRYTATIRRASRAFKRLVVLPMSTLASQHGLDTGSQWVAERLRTIAPELAAGYEQIHRDLQETGRLSFRGTANEVREILREVLARLAPDSEVAARPWYRSVDGRSGPTHQQRARYILERRGAEQSKREVAERALSVVEEGVAKLCRDIYSRSATASHTSQDQEEIRRLLGYLDAVVRDLCG